MNTNSIALAGAISTFALASTTMGSLNGLSYDVIGDSLVGGESNYTVRLYADVDAGDRLDAVYGNADTEFRITMLNGAYTYQHPLGGPTSNDIDPVWFPQYPSLEWDSFVTIGSLYWNGTNDLQAGGIDWDGFEAGGDVSSSNGAWFLMPSGVQGQEQGGRVLIAQFTIYHGSGDYDMAFSAGFQGKDADGVTWNGQGDVFIPAPGALALLGLAGLARTRRRRS